MLLSCPNASAVQSISHEGKVVLVATVSCDGVSSLRYSVKQDGFEQSALQNPQGSGWENFKPLPLPNDSIGDASVEQWEARELSDGEGRPLMRSIYRSAQLTADAPVQLISHEGAIHVFRQSTRGTLLVDRFVLDGMTNTLNPKYEVRYKRSRQRLAPVKSMKQGAGGQLESVDGLDFRDMYDQFFTEPSIEICEPLVAGIRDGNFAVMVVPTNEPDHYRWHIFHANKGDSQVQCLSLRSGDDQIFSLYDYTRSSQDPLTGATTYTLLHGVMQRSIALASNTGETLHVSEGLAAVVYDVQREQQTAAGPQLLLDAKKLMLAVPTEQGVMALNFGLAADGTMAQISPDTTETLLRSKQREILLPLSVMDEIRAVGDAAPAPGGTIRGISRSSGDRSADRVKVAVADGEQGQLARLRKGDVVRLFNTSSYNGLYAVRSVDNGAFCIDAPFKYDDVGEWEKLEEEDTGLVFDGLVTGYEKAGDGVVKVDAINHGLLAGDLVQIVESPDVGGEYQILERDEHSFTVQRLWGTAEAVNVKIAMRKRRGLVFDGKEDGITAELVTPSLLADGFTLEAWVKLSRGGSQTLVATVPEPPTPGVPQRCWQAVLALKAGKLTFSYQPINLGAAETIALTAKQTAPLQEWLHVACSFDGEQLRLIQNGVEVACLAGSALESAAAAGHAALLDALAADARQAASDLASSGLPGDHPANYLAGRWASRSSEQVLTPEEGGGVVLSWSSEQLQQSWLLKAEGADHFSLHHSSSGEVLNHRGRLARWQAEPDQLWSLKASSGGWYQLCTPDGRQALAAESGQLRLVAVGGEGDNAEQLWRFDPIGATRVNIAQAALAAARLRAPRAGQGIPVAVTALTVAGQADGERWATPLQGQVSDLRFWDRGRSPQLVSHEMHLQMLGREQGLIGSWRLGGVVSDEEGVQRVFDFSVNANHGIVRGAPYDGGIVLGRTLRDQTTAAVMYSNGDLVAVSEGALYVESFEFRTDPGVEPNNADGKEGAIFEPSLWGRSSRGAEEKQAITPTQAGFQFEDIGEGWWRASSRFVVPQGVRLLRCFELAQVRGQWSTLDIRRHGLKLVSDTVTQSAATESARLKLVSNDAVQAAIDMAEEGVEVANRELERCKQQLELERSGVTNFEAIHLLGEGEELAPVGGFPEPNQAIILNGINDAVTLPAEAIPTGNEITVSFWACVSGKQPKEAAVLAGLDSKGHRTIVITVPWVDGYVHFDCANVNGDWDRLSLQVDWKELQDRWIHWAFTKNAATGLMRMYRDGLLCAEASSKTKVLTPTKMLTLGSIGQESFFYGSLDHVQIWDRERDSREIAKDRCQPLNGSEAGLWGYWRFGSRQARDLSLKRRDGTLQGSPTYGNAPFDIPPVQLLKGAPAANLTAPEWQWEPVVSQESKGSELSCQLRLRGSQADARYLGRLAAANGAVPSLLDDSDSEKISWILESSDKEGAYHLRAPGKASIYLNWTDRYAAGARGYSFKTPPRCLRFDGVQDYVDIPFKAGVHDLKRFTVAFWMRLAKGTGGHRSPLTSRSNANGMTGFFFYVNPNDQLEFTIGRGDWLALTGPKITPDAWIHVCGSYDEKTMRLYINGQLVGEQGCTDFRPNPQAWGGVPLRLGGGRTESSPQYLFKGDLAEVSLWNQALKREQILATMNQSLNGVEPNLVAYYPLTDLETIADKQNCLVDRVAQNHSQVQRGAPQLQVADPQMAGLAWAPASVSLSLSRTPMNFWLRPVAGSETEAGKQKIATAEQTLEKAQEQRTQAAIQLDNLRERCELLRSVLSDEIGGDKKIYPRLTDLLPRLDAAEAREAELDTRKKELEAAILLLSNLDKLRAERAAQNAVTEGVLRQLNDAKERLRRERDDFRNYWGLLLIGRESGRYLATHESSWRPNWGRSATLGVDEEGATVELNHDNFTRGWWHAWKYIDGTFYYVTQRRDYLDWLTFHNPSAAYGGGFILCGNQDWSQLSMAGHGYKRDAWQKQFAISQRDENIETYRIRWCGGGEIAARAGNEWASSLVLFGSGCEFQILGSPGAEHNEGAQRIASQRTQVTTCDTAYRLEQAKLDDLNFKLASATEQLRLAQQELADVILQLEVQHKRIRMLRSICLSWLSNTQTQAQVLPVLPEQEDPRGLLVQGGAIPYPPAASRLTASAGCNGIVTFVYHDHLANIVRARYDAAYDTDGRGEEWIPDGYRAALALEGPRSVLGLPVALFRPLKQQITIEFWARGDNSHPNEVIFLSATDQLKRPVLRIELPNAKEEVVWEAGLNSADGTLDRLSCKAAPALYREGWTHWAFVKDGERGEMRIYANGQLLAHHNPGVGGAKPLQQPLWGIVRASLAGEPGSKLAWQGQISELRIWERALSQRTIESNSVFTLSGDEPGLLAYYPLNEASGEMARDHSGHGFAMRITGATWVPCTAPLGRLPLSQPTALIRDVVQLNGDKPLALPAVDLTSSNGLSLGLRLQIDKFPSHTSLVEFATADATDVFSMDYAPAKQLWSVNLKCKGQWYCLNFKGELQPKRWYHFGLTITAKGDVTAYLNGVAIGTGTLPLPAGGIRRDNWAGGVSKRKHLPYPARIDHLRLWDRVLSAWHMARQALHAPGFGHAVLAEYSRVVIDAQKRKTAMMMRCLAIANGEGIALLDEQWIETLEMKWIGNAQIKPTLIGYIEGAPPIPSENLTEEEDYNGATSVELLQSSDVSYSWTREQDVSFGAELEVLLGVQSKTLVGLGVVTSAEEVKTGVGAKMDFAYHWQNASTVSSSSSLSQSDKLELRGCQEETPRFSHLGRRFIPKNVGYALVTSGLADVFVSRLRRSGRMVGYQVLPVEGAPLDVNTITFLINPAYTMAGSLDGLTGTAATSQRFHRHVPAMRSQYGSLYPASYFRLQEAYRLKAEIDRRDQRRQAFFNQFDSSRLTESSLHNSINKDPDHPAPTAINGPGSGMGESGNDASPEMKEIDQQIAAKKEEIKKAKEVSPADAILIQALENQEKELQEKRSAISKKEQEGRKQQSASRQRDIDDKHKDLSARAHATDSFAGWQRNMENLQIRAAKRNIVNTYVWDGDGGFHAEEQQFASTVEHSVGGSFDLGFAMGAKAGIAVSKVLVECSAYAKLNLTQTMSKTESTSTGMELHVDLSGVESRRITDHRDYPLFPGEKVDRYRFMSFYLENDASHWHDFFNTVVDPEWLASNDEEARALRQTRQALPNKVWRVLHRVTYVERPTLMGFGRQQAPVDELSDAMQELRLQVQDLATKVDKVQRTLDSQE